MAQTGFVATAGLPTARGAWLCGGGGAVTPARPSAAAAARPGARRACVHMDAEAAAAAIKPDAEARMQKTIESTNASFNTVRTGRASASILDRVVVSYYGTETPLTQLASINVSGSSTIMVDAYDKSAIKDIERALMESDIGITPNNDGNVIRLTVPPLTQERRKELAKQVKALAEEGRVAIRNIRRDAVEKCKKLEKAKDIGQDESKTMQSDVQKATDKFIKELDKILKTKEEDIMKV
jgi:ribosome recycling factor